MRPLIYTGLGLSALLAWAMNEVGHIGDNANATFREIAAYKPPPPAPKPVLTMAHYDALTIGMDRIHVYLAMPPVYGREVSRAGRLETRVYEDGDRFIIVTLDDGVLVAKHQSGLK